MKSYAPNGPYGSNKIMTGERMREARYRLLERCRDLGIYESFDVDERRPDESFPAIFNNIRTYADSGKLGKPEEYKQLMEGMFTEIFHGNGYVPTKSSAKFLGKIMAVPWLKRDKAVKDADVIQCWDEFIKRVARFEDFLSPIQKKDAGRLIMHMMNRAEDVFYTLAKQNGMTEYVDFLRFIVTHEMSGIKTPETPGTETHKKIKKLKGLAEKTMMHIAFWETFHHAKKVLALNGNSFGPREIAIDAHSNPVWPLYRIYKTGLMLDGIFDDSLSVYDATKKYDL